jgi:hypothetical protein
MNLKNTKPAWANSPSDPILKKAITKKGLAEWLKDWGRP